MQYMRAIAPSSWTLPSHASLFTGQFSSSHGATYDPNGPLALTNAIDGPEAWHSYRARGLSPSETTLADILKDKGYATGAVVAGPWMKKVFGLNKGFDFYDDADISTTNGRLGKQVTESAVNWLNTIKKDRFFLFLNYFDPHGPFLPTEGYDLSFLPKDTIIDQSNHMTIGEMVALYDGEIRYADHYLGKLMDAMANLGVLDNTLVIITADHGELLWEHGLFGHGMSLFQGEIHIPLIVRYPDNDHPPMKIGTPLQLNDVMAMILFYLGLPLPAHIQAGAPPDIGHPVFSETYPLAAFTDNGHYRALFEGEYKFVWNSLGNHLLYHLAEDPREDNNLVASRPEIASKMESTLARYVDSLPPPATAVAPQQHIDEETKKALKSLGYVR